MPAARERFGHFVAEEIHYCLAHVAAQVEGNARIAGAEQGAQFQRFGAMLRHLQDRHTLVPARIRGGAFLHLFPDTRSEEHTSELQSLMRLSYAVFFLTTKIPSTSDSYSTQ